MAYSRLLDEIAMELAAKISLIESLNTLEDPRQHSNATRHNFQEVLVIALCAVLSDADSFDEIALWGRTKEAWLRQFLTLKNGIPSQDTFLRVFHALNPKGFETAFRRWVSGIIPALGGQLAVDGKSLRGSKNDEGSMTHMVSAFSTELGLALGQEKTEEKSNEITAIPALLESLYIKGLLISIDAMGCQKNIAAQIVEQDGDYLLAVKGNQPTLLEKIEAAFVDQRDELEAHEMLEKSHGRLVVQLSRSTRAEGVVNLNDWPKCKMIGRIDSYRKTNGKETLEQRFYISSRELSPEALAQAARAHWGIENRLHWVLDVNFGEDGCMVRKSHAPQNFSLLKKIVLNLLRTDSSGKPKTSLRGKRKTAAWSDDARLSMLGLQRRVI